MTPDTEKLNAEQRAEAGAQWLDETKPGWPALIQLDELNIWDPAHCVLGQVFSKEAAESEQFGNGYELVYVGEARTGEWICNHGFAGSGLTPAWFSEVQKRQAALV